MTNHAKKYLFDILQAIETIELFLYGLNFIQYQNDLKSKSAVERQLGIVGEAVNKFSKNSDGHILEYTQEIVSFRNRLIHAYDSIDDSIVWAIKTNHLPILKTEIETLLSENSKLNKI